MSFLGFCRRAAYFTLDGLKGGVVRKAIKEIGRIDMLDSVSTEVKEYQKAIPKYKHVYFGEISTCRKLTDFTGLLGEIGNFRSYWSQNP